MGAQSVLLLVEAKTCVPVKSSKGKERDIRWALKPCLSRSESCSSMVTWQVLSWYLESGTKVQIQTTHIQCQALHHKHPHTAQAPPSIRSWPWTPTTGRKDSGDKRSVSLEPPRKSVSSTGMSDEWTSEVFYTKPTCLFTWGPEWNNDVVTPIKPSLFWPRLDRELCQVSEVPNGDEEQAPFLTWSSDWVVAKDAEIARQRPYLFRSRKTESHSCQELDALFWSWTFRETPSSNLRLYREWVENRWGQETC